MLFFIQLVSFYFKKIDKKHFSCQKSKYMYNKHPFHIFMSEKFDLDNDQQELDAKPLEPRPSSLSQKRVGLAMLFSLSLSLVLSGDAYSATKNRVTATKVEARAKKNPPVPAPKADLPKAPATPADPYAVEKRLAKAVVNVYRTLIDGDMEDEVKKAASKHNVDVNLVKAVIFVESKCDPNAISPKKASGLMQLNPKYHPANALLDPDKNIDTGVAELKRLLDLYNGDVRLALAAYNAGTGAVNKAKGIPAIPETQDYVDRVINFQQLLKGFGL
jgi:hypothetical protein